MPRRGRDLRVRRFPPCVGGNGGLVVVGAGLFSRYRVTPIPIQIPITIEKNSPPIISDAITKPDDPSKNSSSILLYDYFLD